MRYFLDTTPNIEGNSKLRKPQIEAYLKIRDYFNENKKGEALVVLPTGTGKSGLISIAPYGICKKRTLIITPGIVTKKSIIQTLHPIYSNFLINQEVLFSVSDIPVLIEYESDCLLSSLNNSDIVVSNVHKLTVERDTSLLNRVSDDFFDLIIIDEAHHSVAASWQNIIAKFNQAKVLHVTGTPYRGDHQEVPGEKIHETQLSEVMRDKYVKYLRKENVNSSDLYFTIPGEQKKLTIDEVRELKDREWVEKSVALSKECSLDVIDQSIMQRKKILEAGTKDVPHKIIAVACSIEHAKDVCLWYEEKNMSTVLIHSGMDKEQQEEAFLKIENHKCEVVVSVNMLIEGYDHKYLSVLAIFRPYRSLNAFAQIIGRVLRAIPENEITAHDIDNNAVVIFHEEIGLNVMWRHFQKEMENSKKLKRRDYSISEQEYLEREYNYADVESSEAYVSNYESYLPEYDFNLLFKEAWEESESEASQKLNKIKESIPELSGEDLEDLKQKFINNSNKAKKKDIDQIMFSKRPEAARKQARKILIDRANDEVALLLEEKGIDPKEFDLYPKFSRVIKHLSDKTPNDGILVRFINSKMCYHFGPVNKREPTILRQSLNYLDEIIKELGRMI